MTDPAENPMAQSLRENGYRLTKPRLAILQVLQHCGAGLTPEEIHQHGRRFHRPLGLVTVYRTLDILGALGLVRRVHSSHRCLTYASADSRGHYVVCRHCHHVAEFPCAGLTGLIDQVRQDTGYVITEHLLELEGLCPTCQAQHDSERSPASGHLQERPGDSARPSRAMDTLRWRDTHP